MENPPRGSAVPSRVKNLLARIAPSWFPTAATGTPAQTAARDLPESTATSPAVAAGHGQRVNLLHVLRALLFPGSAAVVAWAFHSYYGGPMLPTQVFAVGSIIWMAAAALAYLNRRGRFVRQLSAERARPRADYVLFWIGLLWAFLTIF